MRARARGAGALTAYVHNNPVRFGLVREASASTWTSHRAWMGLEPPPPWLAVDRGLLLSGFDSSADGRAQFDACVRARSKDPSDLKFSANLQRARRRIRARMGLPIEIASPPLPPLSPLLPPSLATHAPGLERTRAGLSGEHAGFSGEHPRLDWRAPRFFGVLPLSESDSTLDLG